MNHLLAINIPPGRRRSWRRFLALTMAEAAEQGARKALAEAEIAFCAGRGDDGRRALDTADLSRGAAAGFRSILKGL